jgi:hypothetical protein
MTTYTNIGTLRGDPGTAGATGDTGATGDPGATGDTGATGARGSKWYAGHGAPDVVALADWVPDGTTSAAGDWYLNTDTGDFYEIS